MKKYLLLILYVSVGMGQNCTANDGTDGVELWGYCYSIENTDTLSTVISDSIPPEIGNLTNLIVLHLIGNNDLENYGIIPPEIGNLTNLEFLEIENLLTGAIPPEIGNLINLRVLHLGSNELTGSIPSEIGNLNNLIDVELHQNQLSGEIPNQIWNITSLEILWIWGNQLTGEITEIGNLVNLKLLALDENQLSGEIPAEIGNLDSLRTIWLNDNQFTGELPLEIGDLSSPITWFRLENNSFSGTIPESICNLEINWSSPIFFNLSNNQFCPPYPTCIEEYVGEQDTSNCEQLSIIDETLPISYNLYNAYPNPFNPVTTLRYDLPEDALVNITIYDMMGRQVSTLVSSQQSAGYKSIQWDATNNKGQPVSAGLYLYTIEAGKFRQTKKMVLLK